MFWITCVSKLSVHTLPTITQDNRDYTVLGFESISRHRLQRQFSVRAVHTYIYKHSNIHIQLKDPSVSYNVTTKKLSQASSTAAVRHVMGYKNVSSNIFLSVKYEAAHPTKQSAFL
jgi:hypothetical protein